MTPSSPDPAAPSRPLIRRLTVRHLFVLVPVAALAWRAGGELGDNSFLWHVRAGTVQLEAGEVLRADPFSFTAGGQAWRTQSWLLELLYGWAENAFGSLRWVPIFTFCCLAATLGFVGLAVYRRVKSPGRTAALLTVVAWVGLLFTVPRPVAVSFVLLAVFVVILDHPERLGWALVPLTWLWASVHGLFVLGLLVVFLEAVRRRSPRLLVLLGLAGAAALSTAHGFGVLSILLDFFESRGALRFLSEWKRPDFLSVGLMPVILIALALAIGFASRRIEPSRLILVAPLAALAAVQLRSVFPALVVLAPIAASALKKGDGAAPSSGGTWQLNAGIAIVLAAFAVVGLARPVTRDTRVLPTAGAVEALRSERLFHGPGAGGFLIWADYPSRRVFVDDRAELYGEEFFEDLVDTIGGARGTTMLDAYGLEEALVKTSWALDDTLRDDGWIETYRDDRWAVYQRPGD